MHKPLVGATQDKIHEVLPEPAFYAPYANGRYEVAMGLRPLGADYGNGSADARVFQLDREFPRYHWNKVDLACEAYEDHVGTHLLSGGVGLAVRKFIAFQLTDEYPGLFTLDSGAMTCALTRDTIAIDEVAPEVKHDHGLHTFASQIQEDIAVVSFDADNEWVSAVHVCAPSRWSPREKLGQSFAQVHAPVPHMESISAKGSAVMRAVCEKGRRLVRFVWGITFDDALNHHPSRPVTPLDPDNPHVFVRVERQVLVGLPEAPACLFFIRPYVVDCADLAAPYRHALADAVQSMPEDSREYKSIAHSAQSIIAWLKS